MHVALLTFNQVAEVTVYLVKISLTLDFSLEAGTFAFGLSSAHDSDSLLFQTDQMTAEGKLL